MLPELPAGSIGGPVVMTAVAAPKLDDVAPPPPLLERVEGALLDPRALFARHDAAWGWLLPWLLVAACGVLVGALWLVRTDVTALHAAQTERAFEQMPASKRKLLDDPKAAEAVATANKFVAFGTKVGAVLGPPLLGLTSIIGWGTFIFVASLAARGKGARPDFVCAISAAAHVQLVELVGLGARAVGVLGGNPLPATSPANLADPIVQPVAAAALGRLDPTHLLFYAALAAALEGAARLPRRLAVVGAAAAWGLASLAAVGAAGAAALANGLGQQ